MTPLPGALAPGAPLVAWRLDAAIYASTWDSGIGAEDGGGRWNPKGLRVVYASFDPATTILESAVHRGFDVLDTKPFMLTSMRIEDPADVTIVWPKAVPNPAWLHGGIPSAGQQEFGARLLAAHVFVAIPSVVSKFSWNVFFRPDKAAGRYVFLEQDRLALDTRLNPPARPRP
jgi:RES domain-containing protein